MDVIPSMARLTLALKIIEELHSHGHKAYLVGGCVRDRLLGLEPRDYDVSTDATPQHVLSYFPKSQKVGAHFGVVTVCSLGGEHVEVATFRSEGAYADGRRPEEVQFETDPRMDVLRRDFTVNGLMEDPLSGEVLDFIGGRADLTNRIIRAIGDPRLRFEEDHLRMLRGIRFAARLEFTLAAETLAAIRELAPSIHRISAERIRDELLRILTEGHAEKGFELLDQSGLLTELLPEVKAFQGVEQPPEFHPEGDVWKHVLLMLQNLDRPTNTLATAVLLHDVGKPPTYRVADRIRFNGHAEVGAAMSRTILNRLRFSNDETDQVVSLVANHMKFKDVRQMRPSTLKRFLRLPRFEEHLELHRLDCMASNGLTDSYTFVREQAAEMSADELRPHRLITGRDLLEAGYKAGPEFAKALHAVETAQLEGNVSTREQALALAEATLEGAVCKNQQPNGFPSDS